MDVYNLSVRTTKCINTKLLIDENIIFFYYQPNFTFSKKKITSMLKFFVQYLRISRISRVLYVFQLEFLWNLLLSRIQIQTYNAFE